MKQEFTANDFLTMEYDYLEKYTSLCVLEQNDLISTFKNYNIKHLIELFPSIKAPEYRGTLRCICAFIGIPDPCRQGISYTVEKEENELE